MAQRNAPALNLAKRYTIRYSKVTGYFKGLWNKYWEEQTTNNNCSTGSFDDIYKHQWGALLCKRPPLSIMLYLSSYPLLLAVSCR